MACKVWLYAVPTLPPASDVVVALSGGTVTVMLKLALLVAAVGVWESVTVTVKFDVLLEDPVGVPEITPALLKLNPAGKLPAVTAQLYGGTPPVAWSVWLYAVPIVAGARDVVVMVNGGGGFTVTVTAWLAEFPAASLTWKVTELLPAPVGVPATTPVLPLRLNPAGRDPESIVHLNGLVPPDTPNVALKAVPAVAVREVVVIAGRGLTLISTVADFVVSVTEVAVTVAMKAVVTLAGAL